MDSPMKRDVDDSPRVKRIFKRRLRQNIEDSDTEVKPNLAQVLNEKANEG